MWRGETLLRRNMECEFGEEGVVEGPLNIVKRKEVEEALRVHEKW